MPDFVYQPIFEHAHNDPTPYRKLPGDFVRVEQLGKREILTVEA